jgi:putative molybdopterin biosynthesis protein
MSTPLMKPKEVSTRLGISPSKAYDLMTKGRIPTVRIDGSIRVEEKDLEEYIKNNKSSSGPFSSITK